jgi:hypothetical protein
MRFAWARRSTGALLWAILAAQLVSGCAERNTEGELAGQGQTAATRRPDISPGGATISMAVDGAPETVAARLTTAMATAAAEREIVVTDAKKAKYLVRGYVSAYPVDGGVAIAYVFDVFDAKRHRAQRLNDAVTVKTTGDEKTVQEPWAFADDKALAGIATRSADDLAAYLSTTPEAAAALPKSVELSKSLRTGLGADQMSARPALVRPTETMGMVPAQ